MNIFFLDSSPKQSALWLKDSHVLKMGIEAAQMLSAAWHILDPSELKWIEGVPYIDHNHIYKRAYENHPMTRWVRANVSNYAWCWNHGMAVMNEYHHRWGRNSNIQHLTHGVLSVLSELPPSLPEGDFTIPPLCMPEQYHNPDHIQAYRAYYKAEKLVGAQHYTNREIPPWAI